MNWYAIYTKPKTEDLISHKLGQAGIETYSPKLSIKKYVRRRYSEVIEPLFPCYLFAKFEPRTHLWMINYTRGVRKVVGDKEGQPWPVADEIIDFIRSNEKGGCVHIGFDEIAEGDAVEIAEGPLKGITGIFKQCLKGNERVVVLLKAIEYQAKVVVDRASLRKI
ncbi:MAG: transcription termination/antitermination NusG family protein [Nitrospirota bacterium]